MQAISRKLHRHLKQDFKLHQLPVEEVFFTTANDWVTDIHIFSDSSTVNKASEEIFIPEDDIRLLFIQRGNEKIRSQCMKLNIQEGDILYVYGNKDAIERKFRFELEKMKTEMQ